MHKKHFLTLLSKFYESETKVYKLKHTMHLRKEISAQFQSPPLSTIHTDFNRKLVSLKNL